MIPKIYTTNAEVILTYCKDKLTLLSYELCCFYMNCEIFYFPKIAHSKFNVMKQPQKQFLFKHIFKMINDLKSKYLPTEFIGYIKAQFEIMKLNEKHSPLIAPNMLHGKKAEYRYAAWLQMIADKQIKESENNSKIPLKYLDHLMKISKNSIKHVFGENVKFQDFINHQKKLIIMAKSKQIAHVYCFASNWIKQLEKSVVDDIKKFSESDNLNKCNIEDINQIYLKYFDNEINMS
jgi:hypothetical protein